MAKIDISMNDYRVGGHNMSSPLWRLFWFLDGCVKWWVDIASLRVLTPR